MQARKKVKGSALVQFDIMVEKQKKLAMDEMQVENSDVLVVNDNELVANDNGLVADDDMLVVDYYIYVKNG